MLSRQHTDFISINDYLQSELNREIKHEYLEGQIYAMVGASKNHQRIIVNLISAFSGHLRNTPCDTFSSDIKVIIVEVLSKSTRRKDETTKRRYYQTLPSLQEYVLIEQDIVDIEICRRSEGWQPEHYFMGDEISFAAIDLTLSVNDIYERVLNEDVNSFFGNI